jgi:hypothetical protein
LKVASSTNISLELEERKGLRQGRVVIGYGAAECWLRRRQRRQQGIEMGWGSTEVNSERRERERIVRIRDFSFFSLISRERE